MPSICWAWAYISEEGGCAASALDLHKWASSMCTAGPFEESGASEAGAGGPWEGLGDPGRGTSRRLDLICTRVSALRTVFQDGVIGDCSDAVTIERKPGGWVRIGCEWGPGVVRSSGTGGAFWKILGPWLVGHAGGGGAGGGGAGR